MHPLHPTPSLPGLRVIIHTANMILADCNNKTQVGQALEPGPQTFQILALTHS